MLKIICRTMICSFVLLQSYSLTAQAFVSFNTSNSNLPENYTWCIARHPSGAIYVGTDFGLAIFENDEINVLNSLNSGLTSNSVRSIFFDTDGRLWIGTFTGGLFIFDGLDWINLNTQNSNLPDDFIKVIAKDSTGMYWIGTGNGLVKFDGELVLQVYNEFNSPLESRNITAIAVNEQNVKIVGTVNGGLTYIDGEEFTVFFSHNSAIPDNTITDIDFDEFQRPIFAMPDGGVAIHQGGNNFIWYNPIVVSAMPTNSINCLKYLSNGSFYAGSINKGLLIRNSNGSWQSYNTQNSEIASDWIRDLVVDEQGKVWMATAMSGVTVFDPAFQLSLQNEIQVSCRAIRYPDQIVFFTTNPVVKLFVHDLSGKFLFTWQGFHQGQMNIPLHRTSAQDDLLWISAQFSDGSTAYLRPGIVR